MGFGFDPRLILATRPDDTNESLRTLADLMSSAQQRQTQQASLADMLQSKQAGRQRAATLADIYRNTANAPDATAPQLQAQGFGDEALTWMAQQARIRAEQAQALRAQRDPAQLSPEELAAREARANLENARADAIRRGPTQDPAKADNLKLRNDKLRKELGGADAGPNKLLALRGYDLDPGFDLKPEVAETLRSAQGQTEGMTKNVDDLMALYRQYGNSVLPGTARARMEAIARNLQLMAKGKSMYELGVIAGPDMDLLNSVIPVPTGKQAAIADFFSGGGDSAETMERLRVMREQLGQKFDASAKARGYRRTTKRIRDIKTGRTGTWDGRGPLPKGVEVIDG